MAGSIRILYVADDPASETEAVASLEGADSRFVVETASTASEGLSRLSDDIECVLSAYSLTDADGVAFLGDVRERYPQLPFFLFAPDGSGTTASEAVSTGVSEYFPAEFARAETEELASKVLDHVERAHVRRDRTRLVDAVETAREGIAILDEDGRFEFVNHAYAELYGYAPDRLLGERWDLLYPDADVEHIAEDVLPSVRRYGYWRGETRGLRADGSTFIEDHVLSVNDDGELICTVRDITNRKADKQDLELKTRALDAAPLGVVIADANQPDNPIVYANDAFESLTGYAESEIVGRNCRFLQGERTRDEPLESIRRALASHESVSVELRNYRKDGTEFWNGLTIAPVRNGGGDVTHYVGFQTNIDERKAREQDLELLREAVEQAGHGVVITDRNGRIEYVNPAYERDSGYGRREAIGQNPRLVKSGKHSESFYEEMWETILSGELWEAEIINRRKSGRLYHVEQTIAPITNGDGTITNFVGIESDVTQRELRLQRLDVLNRILRHNVRNWMAIVDGNAMILEDALEDEALLDRVSAIRDRAEALVTIGDKSEIVRRLFDQEQPSEVSRDIGAMLSELTSEFETAYPDADIVSSDLESVDARVDTRLKVAIREIVDNAVSHADRPTPTVDIDVRSPDVKPFTNWVDIVISDTGPGIPEHERQAIEKREETSLVHGTGLGLWLSHWIVASYGGELLFGENEPRGSSVTLRLPTA